MYRRYFTARLLRPSSSESIQFTLKYRTSSSDSWKWVNEHSSLEDGELYFQPQQSPVELKDYLKGYDPRLSISSEASDTPQTLLWSITATVSKAEGKDSGYTDINLGLPNSFTRWFSLVRIWSPWLAPRHGKGKFAPTEDAVLSSFLRWDGLHLVILAISGTQDVLTVLRPDADGNVIAHSRNDGEEKGKLQVVVAVGRTFETANAAVMYHARKLVQGDQYMSGETKEEMKAQIDNGIKPEWMENWYDGLTYCTWNGLGQNLNEQKIFDALDILKSNNVKITNLIIDDNWQSLDNTGDSQFKRGMTDFEANKEGFPNGLKYTAFTIRDNHPNIKHIGVWHAILGYWGGISPTGSIAQNYKTKLVRKQKGVAGGTFTVVDPDDAPRFYNDFYKFLLESGVDSVKTDAQFFLDLLDDADDRRRFINTYQDAWTIASLRYFSIMAISCMSQIPQILFHTQMPTSKPRLMVRNSDDFFPDVPSSHPWHIFTNAHNSVFTSHLNILPDWDMFQTSHPYSSFHAAGRCVSGGPIYFTDEPGKHNLDLIKEMTAQSIQGNTIILRPDMIGKTVNVYTAYEEERLLKVGTFVGGTGGISILGCFNVSERPLAEFIRLSDFFGIECGEDYIVRSHTTGELSPPVSKDSQSPAVSLEVGVKGSDILTAYPVRSFTLSGSTGLRQEATQVAVLGLLGKMTGAAAVVRSEMRIEDNGRLRLKATTKALGIFGQLKLKDHWQILTMKGIYISSLPALVIEEHLLITIYSRAIPLHTVRTSQSSALVLEIDIETAWDEMGLQSSWNNEMTMEVFIK